MRKRILSIVLVIFMVVGLLPETALASINANSTNTYEKPPLTTDAYFAISTVSQLYWFADHVNSGNVSARAKLMNSITFASGSYWIPIGNFQAQFSGVFDGNGKTITGLTYTDANNPNSTSYVGLFGAVTGGTVKDLKIVDATVTTASGKYGAGIVVGNLTGGSVTNVELTNCRLEKTAHNDVCLGGIVGYNAGTVSNCKNINGNVKSTGGSYCFIGGIAGRNGTKDAETGEIINCTSSASLSTISGFDCVGGIVGKSTDMAHKDSVVRGCVNTGPVAGATSWGGSRIGGIVGDNDGLVADCLNSGAVTSSNKGELITDEFSAGGIVGANDGKIERCGNSGSIRGVVHFGGIVGFFNNDTGYVKDCWNTGKLISGGYHNGSVGGIVGRLLDGTVENCWSQVWYKEFDSSSDNHFYPHRAVVGKKDETRSSGVPYSGTVTNCWYSVTPGDSARSKDDKLDGTEFIDTYSVRHGTLAYLLNGKTCSENAVWHQTLGTDLHPVTDSSRGVIWQTCGGKALSNTPSTASDHSYDSQGFCTACGAYRPATLVTADNYAALGLTGAYIGYYAIASAGQLYWFSDFTTVSPYSFSDGAGAGRNDANAVLTADITVNTNVLNAEGVCTAVPSRIWLPVCGLFEDTGETVGFTGIFDGNDHTISGLFGMCQSGIDAGLGGFPEVEADMADINIVTGVVGLLGNGGCVRNLSVTDSFFSGAYTGGIAGAVLEDSAATIEGCIFNGHIRFTPYVDYLLSINGGILGVAIGDATIRNSAVAGIIEYSYDQEPDFFPLASGVVGLLAEKDSSVTCENVLYIARESSSSHLVYDSYNSKTIYSLPGVVVMDPDKLTGLKVDVPVTDLLAMDGNTAFSTSVYTLGGTSWPSGDGKELWLGKAGDGLTLTVSLGDRPVYTATGLRVTAGDAVSLSGAASMAKQAPTQTLQLDLTTVSKYLTRGNPVFTVKEWTDTGLNSASVNGNILTLTAESTENITGEDTVTLSVTGLADYNSATVTVTVKYVDKTPVEITGVQTAGDLVYSGQAQPGYTGTPTSAYTGEYEFIYTGTGDTSYGPSADAPKNTGTYRVVISVPESDTQYTGSITLEFTVGSAPDDIPPTGDSSNTALWIMAMVGSMIGLMVMIFDPRKKRITTP